MSETPKKVLAVEDDPDIQVILRMVLSKLGHCDVTIAGEGAQVLGLAKLHQPVVILLDVMLPDMSGFDIIKQLKEDPSVKDIPVIFLTARSQPSEIEQMKGLGAIGYLAKPFDPMTLVSQINDLIKPYGKAIGG